MPAGQAGHTTLGPLVTDWARRRLGLELMAWQTHVLDRLLAHDPSGRLDNRLALVTVARQNGKTTLQQALLGWWLEQAHLIFGAPQHLLYVTHRLNLADAVFRPLVDLFSVVYGRHARGAHDGRLIQSRRSSTGNTLTMPEHIGSTLRVASATAQVGHGFTFDLVLADEVWAVSSAAIEDGVLPTMRARPNPLLLLTSTAGDDGSTLLRTWRERGIRQIDAPPAEPSRYYFAEWSPPPDVDPLSPAAAEWANPALGQTISADAVRAEQANPNRAAYLRASLNLWVPSVRPWLPHGTWESLAEPGPAPTAGTLVGEVSMDGERFVAVRAARQADGRILVGVALVAEAEDELWALALAEPAVTKIAVTPSLLEHLPERLFGRARTVGLRELRQWLAPVRNLIDRRQITHRGDLLLAEHVGRSVEARSEDGRTLSAARSPGPIELARIMVLAAHLESGAPARRSRPMIAVARAA